MELKYREDTTRRRVSEIAIGNQYSCVYSRSDGETLPARGDLLPSDPQVEGAYVTAVEDGQARAKPINQIFVTAIQPLNYSSGAVYSSGAMEVRSSRAYSVDGQFEHLTYLYLSDATVAHTEVSTGNKYVVTSANEDNKFIPGLLFTTLTYTRFRTIAEITSGQTYEIEGSRKDIDSDPKGGERLFVTTDVADGNLPSRGDFFTNRLGVADSGNFGRICTNIQYTTNVIPDRTLVTCSYTSPQQDLLASGEFAAYRTRLRASKGSGIYGSEQHILKMPNALAASTFTTAAIRSNYTYEGLYLHDFQVDYNIWETNARVILNYSSLTADEWMMQNINSGLVYRIPALTAQSKLLDLDGNKMFGKSPEYPNSHYRITSGENVSFIPKTMVLIRAIVDSDDLADYEPYQGQVNSTTISSLGITAGHGIYMGTALTPITGASNRLWQAEAKFLVNTKDWNDQCELTMWETRKIWVAMYPGEEWSPVYAGWVEVRLGTDESPHPGDFTARLIPTHDFSAFGAMVS